MLLGTSLIFPMKLWEQIVIASLFLYSVCTVLYAWKDETFFHLPQGSTFATTVKAYLKKYYLQQCCLDMKSMETFISLP